MNEEYSIRLLDYPYFITYNHTLIQKGFQDNKFNLDNSVNYSFCDTNSHQHIKLLYNGIGYTIVNENRIIIEFGLTFKSQMYKENEHLQVLFAILRLMLELSDEYKQFIIIEGISINGTKYINDDLYKPLQSKIDKIEIFYKEYRDNSTYYPMSKHLRAFEFYIETE